MKRTVGLAVAMVLVAQDAVAGVWSAGSKIKMIEAGDVGAGAKVYISFNANPLPSAGCANADWVVLGGSLENIKNMTALATSAHLSSRSVAVYWNGACSGGGSNGYPVIVGIQLH